jgi:hypothetical protein
VNRTYHDAVDELKASNIIDDIVEIKAKEQSNLEKMAQEVRIERIVSNKIHKIIKRILLAVLISAVVSFAIIKFKTIGLVTIITLVIVYILVPTRDE